MMRCDEEDGDGALPHRSWPSSPLSASRRVTARLYSSLQHSRAPGGRGHDPDRQVSFALSSPDLTAARATMATPPLLSNRLDDLSPGSSSSRDVIGSGVEGVESEAEELDLHLLSGPAQPKSGRRHIEEMESVRTHLQSILRATPTAGDRHDFLTPASQHFLDDSHDSDTTSNLLSGVCVEQLFPRYSRLHPDASAGVSELQVLRESLERERQRRKVCEQQVASLHSKVLQFQQQLTLAVAADRKKDIMIEQLDKTLVKVVEGWKRHDQERNEEIRRLQEEKETAERTHSKHTQEHTQALSQVEQNLSQVEERLKKEQKLNEELRKSNKRLEQEASELHVRVEDLQQGEQKRRGDTESLRDQLHALQAESHDTRAELQRRTQELQQQRRTHTDQLKQEACAREEAESRTRQIQEELDTSRRERDALRVERALEQSRFEAQKSQMEAEFRLSLEQQISERLTAVQEENTALNTQLRQQHRKQLLDLSARHERELASQLDHCRTQVQERDDRLTQLTLAYQHKQSEMQEQMVSMAASKRKLETQREELVSRLQGMMRSHWAEAVRLLTNQEQMGGVLSPVHQWLAPEASTSPPQSDARVSAPQAVVLHLSRERERETQRTHREKSTRDECSLINHSQSFSPLEPQLDNTDLTTLSDYSGLWVRPMFTQDETMKETREETRAAQTNLKQTLNRNECELKQSHAPTDTRTNHSSSTDSGLGRGGASALVFSSNSEKAPPLRDKAPPNLSQVSCLSEDRQTELQYYVSKLLERSPGDPLDEPIREQRRSESADLRSSLEQRADPLDKQERGPSRSVQSRRPAQRRGGSQRVWR